MNCIIIDTENTTWKEVNLNEEVVNNKSHIFKYFLCLLPYKTIFDIQNCIMIKLWKNIIL